MTGTAMTEASEFDKIYRLGVVPIPTNMPMIRKDQPDLVYRTEDAKYDAVVEDIAERNAKGQPILVGTVSVEKSEHLSRLLKKRGVPHTVLNAKQHADEAKVVALAGHKGAVTVATNMAGRGTDIMLGGSVDFLADDELRKQGLDPVEDAEDYDAAWPAMVEKIKAQVANEHDEVRELGGLYVVGTERHESRRIDNQLRGRSGRQGDPGESRFYLSLQDELMRLFKSEWVDRVLTVMKVPDDVPIENKRVTGAIANAQGQVESQNFESRKNVLKYDDVMNRQREVIYAERREVLEGADLEAQIRTFIDDVVDGLRHRRDRRIRRGLGPRRPVGPAQAALPVTSTSPPLEKEAGGRENMSREVLIEEIKKDAHAAYDRREAEVGEEVMRELERRVVLSVLDRKWREHLYEMDYLREGIYLRAYSQRDPLVEYQREGFDMFATMMEGIKEESVGFLFNLDVEVEEDEDEVEEASRADARRAAERPARVDTEPMRSPLGVREAAHAVARRRRSGPRASTGPSSRSGSPTPPRPRTATPRSRARRLTARATSSPTSAATPCAPAARARSTSAATAPPAGRPA